MKLVFSLAVLAAALFQQQPADLVTFTDFRPVGGGLIWPHRMVTMQDGKTYDDVQIKSYEINGKAPKVLAK